MMLNEVNDGNVESLALCLRAFAQPIRLKIIATLMDREMSVQELVDAVGTTQSNVSQHLIIMQNKNILRSRREGKQIFYRIGNCKMMDLMVLTQRVFCAAQAALPTSTL